MNSKNIEDKVKKIIEDVEDDTKSFNKKEIEEDRILAILSYVGFLSLIPYFYDTKNRFVKYHALIGVNLLVVEAIGGIGFSIAGVIFPYGFWFGMLLSRLFYLFTLVLSIIGIINVINGKAKELPIINKIKIIK